MVLNSSENPFLFEILCLDLPTKVVMRACNRVTLPLLLHYAIKYFFDPLCFIRNITQRIGRLSTRNKDCERNNELISVRKAKA